MEGRDELSITNQFFKVMMPGFHQKLNMPPIVSKELEKQKSRRVVLESRIRKWSVTLCRNHENGLMCLKQGWPKFVERHALKIGEFVFFTLTDDLHFNVSVFGTNLSEKEFRNEDKDDDEEEETETLNPMEEAAKKGVASFMKKMKPEYARKNSQLNISLEFMRANNLGGPQQSNVVLNDPNGRRWPVSLTNGRVNGIRFRMKKGWHDFYASNALKDGDHCVFHLNRRLLTPTTIVFDVDIFRGGEMAIGTKFVKIMMPDLMEKMKVPSDYSEKLKQEKSKKAVLITHKGSWEMKVRKDVDGDIFFEDGWPTFAHDHALNVHDFLVFQHTGNLHFDVVVCDALSACKKKYTADCMNANQPKEKAEKKGVDESQSMPSFPIEIKHYIANNRCPMVNIPLQFVRANNLESQKSISVRDPLKRRWVITLLVQHEPQYRVCMCGGWAKFYAANHLKIGDECIFHLNPTSQTLDFDVQIVSSNP